MQNLMKRLTNNIISYYSVRLRIGFADESNYSTGICTCNQHNIRNRTAFNNNILFYVKPKNILGEAVFTSVVMAILTIVLTLVLHGLIEHDFQPMNFIVTLIAFLMPFICLGIYQVFVKKVSNAQ